jgi:hypothetical protein
MLRKPLTPLEDATLRMVMSSMGEADGWLDLTRVCSRTARMLPDVQRAVARLVRRKLLSVDAGAPNTERWLRFVLPSGEPTPSAPAAPREPVP